MADRGKLPLWLKGAYTLFLLVLVPTYLLQYGPIHFLWSSDLTLFLVLGALWRESRLLAGMAALASLLPETGWILSILLRVIGGLELGLTDYMFDPALPLHIRLLSLFHLFLPPFLLWLIHRLGYDQRSLRAMTVLAWAVLLTVFFLGDPEKNINFVFGFRGNLVGGAPLLHLGFLMAGTPLLLYLPTHLALKRLFPSSPG